MRFEYVASTNNGRIVRGESDLLSREAVIQELRGKGLIVVSVTQGKQLQRVLDRFSTMMLGTISFLEKVIFFKHLSLMLRAGLTVAESLEILIEQTSSRRFRFVVESMHNDVMAGESFAQALLKFPKVFAPYMINVIAAGELAGTLEGNLTHLADQLTKENELRSRVKSAMLYPAVVLAAALTIGYIFAIYVIPQVAALFVGLKGISLPPLTVAMLAVAGFLKKHTISSIIGTVGGVIFLVWFVRRAFLRPYTHYLLLKLPIVGGISKHVNLARFSLVLGTMLRSGVDIITACKVTATVVENYHYRRAILAVAKDMTVGKSMVEALEPHADLFPKVASRMLGVGERSGKLDEVLSYLADFYQLEVETAMRNLSTLLEPILLLVIGVIALLLAFSILMPIYSFVASIRKI